MNHYDDKCCTYECYLGRYAQCSREMAVHMLDDQVSSLQSNLLLPDVKPSNSAWQSVSSPSTGCQNPNILMQGADDCQQRSEWGEVWRGI